MKVTFFLEKNNNAILALYDLQGRLVKMVINEQILSNGEHNITVERNDLAVGVYLCTLDL